MLFAKGTKHLDYPNSNEEVIDVLKLQKHPEGGYFAETDRQEDQVPSPFADDKLRPLATTIYYLLTYDEPVGAFLMNKSVTVHVLHQGRAEYTLIYPEHPPRVEKAVMGPNIEAGEKLQLLVGSNVWKKSKLLDDDVAAAEKDHAKCDRTGCLITEVVFPGFHWEDHKFMSRDDLERLWGGKSGWEEWVPFIRSE